MTACFVVPILNECLNLRILLADPQQGCCSITKTIPELGFTVLYRTNDASLQQEVELFIAEWQAGAASFEVFTSGSTGLPKRIGLDRSQLIASARRTLEYFDLGPGDSALLGISPKTIGGKMMIVRALIGGLKLIVCSPSANPLTVLESGETLDFCPLVPMQAQRILETDALLLQRVRNILLGGAPLSEKLEKDLTGLHSGCYMGYGMTETVSHIALRRLGNPVYMALRGVVLRQEQDGRLVISDAELGIRQLITNDLVELIDARQFTWLGRSDFAINSGGVKIYPEQLERVLAGLIPVPFFIAAEPDDTFGQKCIIIADETDTLPDLALLQQHCREHVGTYAVPKKMYTAQIIYTYGSKIDRRATLQQLGIA
jgi:o-succinylbenzoate---CoA ligase